MRRGRFVIQDVSAWGTSVNEERIPAPERSADGVVVKPGAAKELPARCPDRARRCAGDSFSGRAADMTWLYWVRFAFLFFLVATVCWLGWLAVVADK